MRILYKCCTHLQKLLLDGKYDFRFSSCLKLVMTEAHAVHSDASKLKYVTMLTKQKYLFSRNLKLREIDLRLLN